MRWTAPVFVLMLAGCFDSDASPGGDGGDGETQISFHPLWHELALASGDGHDHGDWTQHAHMTTPNFVPLGHDPLVTPSTGTAPGGSSCGDAAWFDDASAIGVVKAQDSRAVILTDLSDPAAPRYLGELWLTSTHIYDVAVVADGLHLALVTSQPKDIGPVAAETMIAAALEPAAGQATGEATGEPARLAWRDACGRTFASEDPLPRPVSLLLVRIGTGEPEVVDHRPLTGLGHGVFSTQAGGDTWVVGITESLAQGSRHFHLYQVAGGEAPVQLLPLSVYVAQPNPDHLTNLGGHSDAWIDVHPGTGQTLATFVAGPQVDFVDLSEPRAPVRVGSWTDIVPGRSGDHVLHSAVALPELRDGRHYTIIGPELGGRPADSPSGIVWVLDTTDPSDPHEVAAWTLPADVEWGASAQFSNHYMAVEGDTLFTSMYHGGVWAADLSGIASGSPAAPHLLPSVGVWVPAVEAPEPEGFAFPWTPNLEEVFVRDGVVVTFDSMSGVHTARYLADQPAPAPEPWPVQPIMR